MSAMYLPDYKRLVYSLEREISRGAYQLANCPPGFAVVPDRLRVEERQYNDSINADLLLIGPGTYKDRAGKRAHKFMTGLRPTGYFNLYEGNTLTSQRDEKKKKNWILCRFSADASTLVMLYFPGFYPPPPMLKRYIEEIVKRGLL